MPIAIEWIPPTIHFLSNYVVFIYGTTHAHPLPIAKKWCVLMKKVKDNESILYPNLHVLFIGFQHRVCVEFCACEPEVVTLVRHNMWPATPKNPSLAFHQDLLLWLESLILEGCIGVDAFCQALDWRYISEQVSEHIPVCYTALMRPK